MEFNEKLQSLRKQKGLTQQELADALFVTRTAISKWESSRGYPNIDSLKAIANFFSVTIDELLSGDQVLDIAEQDRRQKEHHFRDLVFGFIDLSVALFLFLPLFGQKENGIIQAVSFLSLNNTAPYMRMTYAIAIIGIIVCGVLTLALQNTEWKFWVKAKNKISLILNAAAAFLLVFGLQPYAASVLFIFLIIKALLIIKKP